MKDASETALTAAAARAAHLIVDPAPHIFADTLAATLLGPRADEFLGYHRRAGQHPILVGARTQATCRARYTEQRVAAAVHSGVTQYVILGAGLDSFAYRSPLAGRLRVYEVDHPATQAGKRDRLSSAGIAIPDGLSFVPVDFESDRLADRLRVNGFDPGAPAIVSWLGVIMYLSDEAIDDTLASLGSLAPGSSVVLDYMLPEHRRDAAGQSYVEQVMPVAAERGEPWRSFFTPEEMSGRLTRSGFSAVVHVAQRDSIEPDLWHTLRPAALSQLAQATV